MDTLLVVHGNIVRQQQLCSVLKARQFTGMSRSVFPS